jgi:hypothetical protein
MEKMTDISSHNDVTSIKKINRSVLWSAIAMTMTSIGPMGWFLVDLADQHYERLDKLFFASLVMCALSTWRWIAWFRAITEITESEDD